TAELNAANQAMRLVLDNVDQGLLVIDAEGKFTGSHSATVDAWFAPLPNTLFELLSRLDANAAAFFQLNWEMLHDGFMPSEVCIEQLPSRISQGEGEKRQTFSLTYRPIMNAEEKLEQLLVVITDITAA